MNTKIIRNSITCNLCGDQIMSIHVHDFQRCKCGKVAVDGGKEYLKRCGEESDYTDTSIVV